MSNKTQVTYDYDKRRVSVEVFDAANECIAMRVAHDIQELADILIEFGPLTHMPLFEAAAIVDQYNDGKLPGSLRGL